MTTHGSQSSSVNLRKVVDKMPNDQGALCSTIVNGERFIWRTARLWQLSTDLEIREAKVIDLEKNLNKCHWFFTREEATPIAVMDHMRRINKANLDYPIILAKEGWIMDGIHRLSKAYYEKIPEIKFVQFDITPEPNFIMIAKPE